MAADETKAARLERLSAADWDSFVQRTAKQSARIVPLLYWRLKALHPDAAIPAAIVQRLREIYLHDSLKRSTRLYHELAKVLRALRDNGISVIVLKGAHLSEIIYGDIALRPMSDVDLLVRKADLLRAGEILLELGYTPFSHRWREAVDAASHHLPPFSKQDAAPVEIHWTVTRVADHYKRLTAHFQIDVDGLWKRARPASIADVQVLTLSPEDLLLHLCLHASYHHGFRVGLGDFCDITHTIQHYRDEMDWAQVQACARQWRADRCVYLVLRLAQELLEATVPDAVLNALVPDDFDPRFVVWAKEQVFAERDRGLPDMRNLARVQNVPLLQKVVIGLKTVFCPPEVVAVLYSVSPRSKRIYLYYLVRLKDLFLKYGRTVRRIFRRDRKVMTAVERENRANALLNWMTLP
jgi:hypothetical protein